MLKDNPAPSHTSFSSTRASQLTFGSASFTARLYICLCFPRRLVTRSFSWRMLCVGISYHVSGHHGSLSLSFRSVSWRTGDSGHGQQTNSESYSSSSPCSPTFLLYCCLKGYYRRFWKKWARPLLTGAQTQHRHKQGCVT